MNWRRHLVDAGLLSVWKAPRFDLEPLPASGVLLLFALTATAQILDQFFHSSGLHSFSIYGINAIIAFLTVVAVIIAKFARIDPTSSTLRNLVLIYLGGSLLSLALSEALWVIASNPASPKSSQAMAIGIVSLVILCSSGIWMAGAAKRAFQQVRAVRRPMLRAIAFTSCLYLAALAFPYWPVFAPGSFKTTTANMWEIAYSVWTRTAENKDRERYAAERQQSNEKAERIEASQPGRMDAALAALERRDADKSNIFLMGLSGWSEQDVFASETEQSLQILKSHFGVGNRVIRLVNAENAVGRYPIASIQNLSAALHGIGARMDRERDVLILTMTSHGSREGLALSFGDLVDRSLDPPTLKFLLDEAGIKNRILIVSTCYSGVFIPPLADDNTMILTAASAIRTSFGCASGRKWTYFGDAFFAHGLGRERTLAGAFSVARKTVGEWEREQRIAPSDPQIFVGKAIAGRFPTVVGEAQQQAMLPYGFSPTALR